MRIRCEEHSYTKKPTGLLCLFLKKSDMIDVSLFKKSRICVGFSSNSDLGFEGFCSPS